MKDIYFLAMLFAAPALSLNILLNNDDGFGSAQLRETFRLLRKAGHNAVVVAPVENQSGQGGRSVFSSSATLQGPSQYNLVDAGSPAVGRDPMNDNVWYYNGTPAACTFVGLDYVIPKFYDNMPIDLFVSGPNFGFNLGPFLYTLSGTIGSTYAAVGRGVPGIAFSAGNTEARSYKDVVKRTAIGLKDSATLQARLVVDVVKQLAESQASGAPLLPLGYGISVNTPYITSATNKSCVNPKFVQTRMTGGAFTDKAVYDSNTGLFTYANTLGSGVNADINGNFKLPGETDVLDSGCQSSVTVFTVDYDAPRGSAQAGIRSALSPLIGSSIETRKRTLSARQLEEHHPLRHE